MGEVSDKCSLCRCGCCKDECPMYSEILEESISPKGRNALIRAITQGKATIDARAVRIAYSCLLCKRDELSCSPHLKNAEATEAFRRYLVDNKAPLLAEHETLIKSLQNYGDPWQEPRAARKRWAKGFERHRLRPGEHDTLLYVGCTYALDRNLQQVPRALSRIMEKSGENFGLLLDDEICCGSSTKRIGQVKLFEKLRAENEKRLKGSGVRTIVTSCAGCFKTLKQDYAGLGDGVEILHSTEFLERRIKESGFEFGTTQVRVTYHDPCHLGRHANVYDPPRAVLKSIPGLEMVEMSNSRDSSRCCGGGAGVKTAYPLISRSAAVKRVKEAEDTGSSAVVTSCPFCSQTLGEAAASIGSKLEVLPIEVLVDRMMKHGVVRDDG